MNEVAFQAADFTDPDENMVQSAERLASAILDKLADQEKVIVSLRGMRGVSSSYFNVLLRSVATSFGAAALKDRISFLFDSFAQELVYERSLKSFSEEDAVA